MSESLFGSDENEEISVGSIAPITDLLNSFLQKNKNYHWIPCHGQYVLKTQYPQLYNCLGDMYGNSSLCGKFFKIPDIRKPDGSKKINILGQAYDHYIKVSRQGIL